MISEKNLSLLGPKFMFTKHDRHYPSRSGQTCLARAVTNITKPVTKINFRPSKGWEVFLGEKCYCYGTHLGSMFPIGPPAMKREKYEIAGRRRVQFERQLRAQWSARKTTFNRSGSGSSRPCDHWADMHEDIHYWEGWWVIQKYIQAFSGLWQILHHVSCNLREPFSVAM